ncbi:glycoside hydrolase family 13 protein [Winogradskyella poriferorum]|uniref:glycoside hydrolase family 13 protein n=1 Tax=Winogradskyella poriferorum TaxID=307627 RepID=UPI003D64FB14
MRNLKQLIICLILLLVFACNSESTSSDKASPQEITEINNDLDRVEPPHWWTDFKNDALQLLVHHPNIGSYTPDISYAGVILTKVIRADSPNYLFLDFQIDAGTEPGKFNITFSKEGENDLVQTYELKEREKSAIDYVGFDSSDALFLITPDRFANGNEANDSVEGLNEQGTDRSDNYARHGGDIQGVIANVDYIKNLGFTALWPQPLLTNDMKEGSYHGYAITDYYNVDPRFGSNAEYRALADTLRGKGMKLIMDQVANHCGLEHWWMKDLPFKDWVNFQKHYEENIDNWNWQTVKHSSHRRTTNQDGYASEIDRISNNQGWFVATMPDLNQRNPFMAKYIIQNSIWWIESLGLGGIRQDTYPYPDKQFMSNWAGAIMTEYPNFNIVGEEWSYNPLLIAYWQQGSKNKDGYNSNLKSTMDFAMQRLVIDGIKEDESWDKGLVKIYEGLANDFHYASPENILVFPDNHDMSRVFTQLEGDIEGTKMALSLYATLPRTVQVYYGTEILMNDFEKPGDHGLIRTDFPGGWQGDSVNAFTGAGLTDTQKDMQKYVSKLFNFRKNSSAIHSGETMHFAPKDNIYVLVRSNDEETVINIINKNEDAYELDLSRFDELGINDKALRNVQTDESITWSDKLVLASKGSYLFTTKN